MDGQSSRQHRGSDRPGHRVADAARCSAVTGPRSDFEPAAAGRLSPLLDYLASLDGRADLAVLSRLLQNLAVTRADLGAACRFGADRYQRNRIAESDWYELVCLCWSSGQRTPIHDHRGSSCAFRVVEGVATETAFEPTPSGLICPCGSRQHGAGCVCASEEDDCHQVANTQPAGEDLITLHIYSPPLRQFNVYSLDTPTASGQRRAGCC